MKPAKEKIGIRMKRILSIPLCFLASKIASRYIAKPFVDGMNGMSYEDHEARAEEVRKERSK